MSDSLEDLYQKAMEIRNQQTPPADNPYGQYAPAIGQGKVPPPLEGRLGLVQPGPPQKHREPDLLHGLVDDATLKAWLLHEITLLIDLIADDDVSIARAEEKLQALRLRRLRLGKLRQAFETLRDDIEEAEGA